MLHKFEIEKKSQYRKRNNPLNFFLKSAFFEYSVYIVTSNFILLLNQHAHVHHD